MTDQQTDDATDDVATYERQAGDIPQSVESLNDSLGETDRLFAAFEDPHDPEGATWRPPNATEYRALQEAHAERDTGITFDRAYVAVCDGYTSDSPGYSGPVAVVLWGFPAAVETAIFTSPDYPEGKAMFREPEGGA